MITSRTYNASAGLNYIQSPDLVFAEVIAVKRDGIQYDLYVSGSYERAYTFNSSQGKIFFLIPFSAGEKVFVLFKTTGTQPDQSWCVPVSILSTVLPGGRLVTPYIGTITFAGTQPMTFSNISGPSWANIFQFGATRLRVVGIPDAVGVTPLTFDVENCGGVVSFSETIRVYPFTPNLFVNRDYSTTTIKDVTLIDYIITSGTLPSAGSTNMVGVHGDYTGRISVEVANVEFPMTLRLKKNGVEIQTLAVTPDANLYLFTPETYLYTDDIEILLN